MGAVIVKTEKYGGCGIEPDADTMPSNPHVESSGPNKKLIAGVAVGAVVAGGIGYYAWKKKQANKTEEIQQEEAVDDDDDDDASGGENPPPIKHPSDFTYVEVKFFLVAIGLENKCDTFEDKQVNGAVLVTLTKTELEAEFGCTSIEARKLTMALEFSIEIELCLVLVGLGFGKRVKDFRSSQINGAIAVSMTKVELQQECGMTTVEVKTFKAVAVKR